MSNGFKSGKRRTQKKKSVKEQYTGPNDLYVYIDYDKTVVEKILGEIVAPKGVEAEDFISTSLIDSYNELNFVYAHITKACSSTCKQMAASPNATYLWADGEKIMDPIEVTAENYIGYLMDFTKNKLKDDKLFPPGPGQPFTPKWKNAIETITKRLLRVYGHIYFAHYKELESLSLAVRFNNAFAKYYLLLAANKLVPPSEIEPIQYLVEAINRIRDAILNARLQVDDEDEEEPKQMIAMFDFTATDEHMISFKKGEIFELVEMTSEDWWLGRPQNGQSGYFPKKFAKPVDDKRTYVQVDFDYDARDSANELTIRKGDILVLINTDDADWWEGEMNGQTGFFPKNFVKKIE